MKCITHTHAGSVTTAFNGGFASVRSLPWPGWAALGRGGGVRLLVRGDGQTYKLNLKVSGGPLAGASILAPV